ncbi:MAG: VWA domain-containing protein [bacterium]
MKRSACLFAAVALFSTANAMSFPQNAITVDGKLNCSYISTSGGTAYLQIFVTTPDDVRRGNDRRPMNISVVLDRSGSMADQGKIDFAKAALNKLIDQLYPEDLFSLVVYDDVIDVLRPSAKVGNKQGLKRLVSEIYPRNSTNLGGGMIEGLRQVECNIGKEYVNRVILLSDGLANQGITDPGELNKIARRYRSKSISLTTMGVGLDYNENLMVGLAESGGGNYYFIESPRSLASIMSKEFNTLSSVVAQNASIELKLGRGVSVLDVIGCDYPQVNGVYTIPVGDLYANESREFTAELRIPEGTGTLVAVTGTLKYETKAARIEVCPSFTATLHYSRDVAVIEKSRDMDIQAKADVAVSTRRVDNALKAFDEGRTEEAQAELKDAQAMLMASPATAASGAGAAAIQEQAARLSSFSKSFEGDDARKAKKEVQYQNYRVRKKK